MGGCVLPLDQALDHIANNSAFWIWNLRKTYKAELRAVHYIHSYTADRQ